MNAIAGKGISRLLMAEIMKHPELQSYRGSRSPHRTPTDSTQNLDFKMWQPIVLWKSKTTRSNYCRIPEQTRKAAPAQGCRNGMSLRFHEPKIARNFCVMKTQTHTIPTGLSGAALRVCSGDSAVIRPGRF